MRITTGALARALSSEFPGLTDDMVRQWVEAGEIDAWRNPLHPANGRYRLKPDSIKDFLRQTLKLTEDKIMEVGLRIDQNFNQLFLKIPA